MRSIKHRAKPEFQPLKNPTPKVKEALSRISGTLSATSFTAAAVVLVGGSMELLDALRLGASAILGISFLLFSVYVLKGA